MSEKKYFKYLAKQCKFREEIEDGYDFKVFIEDMLKNQKVFLIISLQKIYYQRLVKFQKRKKTF